MYSQDGYKLIRADELIGALAAFNEREITFRAFRAYLGCFELLARREAAERSNLRKRGRPKRRFQKSELSELLDKEGETSVSRELSALKAAGLLTFAENAIEITDSATQSVKLLGLMGSRGGRRLIPVPRRLLKFLVRCSRPALVKTVIAYLLRGLSLERTGKIRSAGTVKVSWICELCRISERAARSARAELIRLGWITKDTGSFQRKLNRDGAYFQINTSWQRVLKRFAPPKPSNCTGSAPPKEKLETPIGSKNQKPAHPAARSGFCNSKREEEAVRDRVFPTKQVKNPTLKDIKPEDLHRVSSLKTLYAQAVTARWLPDSESNFQNFVAAAVRATRVNGDPVSVFVGIVRKGLWHHLTNADEDRAVAALKRDSHKCRSPEAVSSVVERLLSQWKR